MKFVRNLTALVLAAALAATGVHAAEPIPGLDAVLKLPARIVWFGEVHGTNETPVFFADIACAAGAKSPVVVALERTAREDGQWQLFLRSNGTDADKAQLLTGDEWSSPWQDGRSSQGMLVMADRLRQCMQAGAIKSVVLIDNPTSAADRDEVMAKGANAAAAANPDAKVLVYTGNLHAMKQGPQDYRTAASFLPPAEVTSVNLIGKDGTAWSSGKAANTLSGVDHARGIVMAADAPPSFYVKGYDAVGYIGAPMTASPPALAEALALTAPVADAFARVEAEQAKLPQAKDDRERLERLFDLDQAGRNVIVHIDFDTLPVAQRLAAQEIAWRSISAHDLDDQKALKAMMPAQGWFPKSKYGSKAASAAFLIVQHAVNDPDLMRDVLRRMEPLIASGEVNGEAYGLLFDRVALVFDHKPQRYGSQVQCKAGQWQPQDLEDPAHVDERRKAAGFTQTEAEYLKNFATMPCH